MTARLFLCTVLIGTGELARRFKFQQQVYRPIPAERELLYANETARDYRRYAVIGLLVKTANNVLSKRPTWAMVNKVL